MAPAEDSPGAPIYWLDEDQRKAVGGAKDACAAGLDLLKYARTPTAQPEGFVSCWSRLLHAAQAARDAGKSVWDDFVRAHRASGRKLPDIEGCAEACCALDLATRFAYAILNGAMIREPDEIGGRIVTDPQQPEVSRAMVQVREMPLPPLSLKDFYELLDDEAGKAGMLRKGLLAESAPLESGAHAPTTTPKRPDDPAKKAAAAKFLRLAAGEWHLHFTRNGERSGEERCRIDAAGGYYLLDRRPGELWCKIEDVQYDAVTRNATFVKVKMRGKRWRHKETVVFLPNCNRMEGHDDSGQSVVYDRLGADAVRCSGDPVSTRENVFISYSHKDNKFLEELLTHLKPLERAGSVTHWSDKQIQPGSKWLDEIKGALACSKVAILLVTKDFLASDFIHEQELTPLLKEAEQDGVTILWVLVRACSYKETPLQHYQAVIPPDKPLAEMRAERDRAWVRICEEIKKAANVNSTV